MKIRILELRQTCLACPSQWEALLDDNRMMYVRYRYGVGAVGIGNDLSEAVHNAAGWRDDPVATWVGREDGYCEWSDVVAALRAVGVEVDGG